MATKNTWAQIVNATVRHYVRDVETVLVRNRRFLQAILDESGHATWEEYALNRAMERAMDLKRYADGTAGFAWTMGPTMRRLRSAYHAATRKMTPFTGFRPDDVIEPPSVRRRRHAPDRVRVHPATKLAMAMEGDFSYGLKWYDASAGEWFPRPNYRELAMTQIYGCEMVEDASVPVGEFAFDRLPKA